LARREDDFGDMPRQGISRYVLWTLAFCLAVGTFLYADGFFDSMIEETTTDQAEPVGSG